MTFAATAEIVRYQGAMPILVDCDPDTFNMDLADAERKIALAAVGQVAGGATAKSWKSSASFRCTSAA